MPLPAPALPFPPPPSGKTGWPWDTHTPLPPPQPGDADLPTLTLVTPSYNQGQFIEETIRSVLLQGYPHLEYIVMDGGSHDATVEILKKYAPWLAHWQSAKDGGQTAAINQGFARATGELRGWQNSDDYFLPDALLAAGRAARAHPEIDAFYGPVDYVDAEGKFLRHAAIREPSFAHIMPYPCVLNQALLIRRPLFERGLRLDENITHCMDYDLLWQLLFLKARFAAVPDFRAEFRQHDDAKGVYQLEICYQEFFDYYLRLLRDKRLPASIHPALIGELRASCLNDFGTGHFANCRAKFRQALHAVGPAFLTPELLGKYAASALPPGWVSRMKRLLRPKRKGSS